MRKLMAILWLWAFSICEDYMALNYFSWYCHNRDERHGMFHEDFGGCCFARSKKLLTSQAAAEKAASAHLRRCRYKNYTQGCTVTGQPRKNSRNNIQRVSEVK